LSYGRPAGSPPNPWERGTDEKIDRPVTIEVCVENTGGLVTAQRAGADRVELCASLIEGGLTPSLGMVEEAVIPPKVRGWISRIFSASCMRRFR
jgi:hypothetical protein